MTAGPHTDEEVRDDEFDQLAAWTADVIETLGLDDPVPAACNGSGSPSSLEWLAEHMALEPGSPVVDTGAGLGGPAAWLARRSGARVVTSEPMVGAVRGSRRLFQMPAVVAWAHQLPFASGSLSGALALAVLSTVDDKGAYLGEVRRVLRPGGRLGLLDYVRTAADLTDPPANNEFLTPDQLEEAVTGNGFAITATAMAADLPPAPGSWTAVSDRVSRKVSDLHRGAAEVQEAERQQERFSRLLNGGELGIRLICASRR